jgi:peptide/nickel transport system substrate-binding protein
MKMNSRMSRLAAASAVLAMGAGVGTPAVSSAATGPNKGGTLTVLEGTNFAGSWAEGLDPATNLSAVANQTLMNAVYGGLFQVSSAGKTVFDLASGYQITNGAKTLTIELRHGVTFSDGTPFNAAAVVYNFKRDLASSSAAKPTWVATSITARNAYTVVVNVKTPDGAIVNQFQDSNVNWIASPGAIAKMGEKAFALAPVGAGPFEVMSDQLDTKLTLKANPNYWQPGHPYLDGLIFQSVANDQTALDALQSNEAQAYEYMASQNLVGSYKSAGYTVTADPAAAGACVLMNTTIAPFNNIVAREAIYYATDSQSLNQGLNGGAFPLDESFTGPSGLFYNPKVPGYRSYDLAKAKALVAQLGGLSFTLDVADLGGDAAQEGEALQTMYEAAGMTVTINSLPGLAAYIQAYESHQWQISPSGLGSWDPAGSTGLAFRLQTGSPFSGVNDPHLDALMAQAAGTVNSAQRAKLYDEIAVYLNKMAYAPFLYSGVSWDVAAKGVQGPGLTTPAPDFSNGPETLWQDVSMGSA